MLAHEAIIEEKDAEIAALKEIRRSSAPDIVTDPNSDTTETSVLSEASTISHGRRGKAPPVDAYTGSDPELRFEDWLPTLERTAKWNNWSGEEKLMQLAGHLRGKAAREYGLLSSEEKQSFPTAIKALQIRLDPGSCALAAQDFRNAVQWDKECVSDYITRLERSFQIAYGREHLTVETRDAFLFSQLQAGLKLTLIESPAVSGSTSYKQLCVSAKQEEKRQSELRRLRQQQERQSRTQNSRQSPGHRPPSRPTNPTEHRPPRECYVCGKTDHIAKQCKLRKSESIAVEARPTKKVSAVTSTPTASNVITANPMQFLDSDSDGSVSMVRVTDRGSHLRRVHVDIAGVPAVGLIDTGADISIMGPELFKKVAAVAGLKKRQLKPADKLPHTYDRRTFKLDGRLDLDVTFVDKTMHTAIYVKMDAFDDLLLSEGVCRQLGIVEYHPQVDANKPNDDAAVEASPSTLGVRIQLVQSVRLAPRSSTLVSVKLENHDLMSALLLEQTDDLSKDGYYEVEVGESLVHCNAAGLTKVLLCNSSGSTCKVAKGTCIGVASEVNPIAPMPNSTDSSPSARAGNITSTNTSDRQRTLTQSIAEIGAELPWQDKSRLYSLLCEYHTTFALEDGERGETDVVRMEINTGEAQPKRQSVRRTPFAARQEIVEQLRDMQAQNVITPSDSPWASPVVLVRKKDGSLRFCIDYRSLNLATKSDTFPLPRIDDLLDQLGNAKYFSTLDLAAGYWQVQMDPDSREKTAFITHQGLYEFNVMPFGLKNAPAVFQRLMNKVLMGLNPENGRDFVAVYLDDVIIFSDTFEDHLEHLKLVLQRFAAAGLKLKPSKCHFICQTVEYLGHTITPQGISPNNSRVVAIQSFPIPTSVKEVRQFVGLASYYRRFINGFAKIAQPLHQLTQKDAQFNWSPDCQQSFQQLTDTLVSSPVLAYPDFSKKFTLETDASLKGLGAVLSQLQEDNRLHPVAYASRSLSAVEKRYAVTELETLAVVWAISHFHAYLYGHDVTVYTDHSAVKAVLETPSPSAKHARWWSKVYASGVRSVQIVYRPGKENSSADALSRNPQGEPPSSPPDGDVQVATVSNTMDLEVSQLLQQEIEQNQTLAGTDLGTTQQSDPETNEIIRFLCDDTLPDDHTKAKKIAAQAQSFAVVDGV